MLLHCAHCVGLCGISSEEGEERRGESAPPFVSLFGKNFPFLPDDEKVCVEADQAQVQGPDQEGHRVNVALLGHGLRDGWGKCCGRRGGLEEFRELLQLKELTLTMKTVGRVWL